MNNAKIQSKKSKKNQQPKSFSDADLEEIDKFTKAYLQSSQTGVETQLASESVANQSPMEKIYNSAQAHAQASEADRSRIGQPELEMDKAPSITLHDLIKELEQRGALKNDLNGEAAEIEYSGYEDIHRYYFMGSLTKIEHYTPNNTKNALLNSKPFKKAFYDGIDKNGDIIRRGYPWTIFRENKGDTITAALDVAGNELTSAELENLNYNQANGFSLELK